MNLKQNQIITYRNGEKGRVLCTDASELHPIVTLREDGVVISHIASGEYQGTYKSAFDIMPEQKTLTGWVNVYDNGETGSIHKTKEAAMRFKGGKIVARLDLSKYNITYVEGEGL